MTACRSEILEIFGEEARPQVRQLLAALPGQPDWAACGRVGIKPNLVLPAPAATGATTHPEVVAGILESLFAAGCRDVVILESAWVGASTREAFRVCGYEDLAREFGVPLIDLKDDPPRRVRVAGEELLICQSALDLGVLINVPVLKAHCQTGLTCALKNLKGCIPDAEKRRFHTLGLHRPIALLNRALPCQLVVVDGLCGDLSFEEGGNPVPMGRLLAGRDAVAIDAHAAALLGLPVADIGYIGLAERLGVGSGADLGARLRQLNQPAGPAPRPGQLGGQARTLMAHVAADQACSACLGGLLHALRRLADLGLLGALADPVAVGQGFGSHRGPGCGVGDCTSGLDRSLAGCPPRAADMVDFLLAGRQLRSADPGSVPPAD